MLSENGTKETGILRYMELTDLKFIPRRMYYITDTPKREIRGKHGHYDDQQYLFCLQGEIKVELHSIKEVRTVWMRAGDVVFLDRMVWSQQQYLTGNDILLVLCSTAFDKKDYITDINEITGDK